MLQRRRDRLSLSVHSWSSFETFGWVASPPGGYTTWKPPPRIFAIRIRRLSLVHALPPGGAGAGSVLRAHMRHEGAHVFVRGGARKVCVVVRYLRCVSCAQPSHSHLALAVLASIVCSCWSDRLRIGSDVAQSARTTRIISLIRKTQSPAVMAASSV